MKRIWALLPIVALLLSASAAAQPAHPNAAALQFCRENGILQGNETGDLRPDDTLTRAEAATILVRLLGATKRASLAGYADVKTDKWYYEPLCAAVGAGLLQGSGGKLNPQSPVTRQEGWVLLARAFALHEGAAAALLVYPDAKQAASWAAGPLAALEQRGALAAGKRLRARENMTRAEFAETLFRLTGAVYDGAGGLPAAGNVLLRKAPPAGARLNGDVLVTGDCGSSVELKNLTIGGRLVLRVQSGARVTLSGTRAQELCVASDCTLCGGSFSKTTVRASRVSAERGTSLGVCTAETPCALTLDGSASELICLSADTAVSGKGSAARVRLDGPRCSVTCRTDRIEKNYETAFDELKIGLEVPVCEAGSPTVTVLAAFSGLPEGFRQTAKLVWCVDGVPYLTQKEFTLQNGARAAFPVTTIFSGQMADRAEISLTVTSGTMEAGEKADMTLQNFPASHYARLSEAKKPYRLEVLRDQNVVLVWALDEAGGYSLLQNAFLCSTGPATSYGTYSLSDYSEWRTLFGSPSGYPYVYGQYSVRIEGNILFHTVPYFSQNKNDLEYLEFNKLGTSASLGCVRLYTAAEKWIYDNCPPGTPVELHNADTLSIPRPAAPVIDPDSPNRGWDPTDPDPDNPWKQ